MVATTKRTCHSLHTTSTSYNQQGSEEWCSSFVQARFRDQMNVLHVKDEVGSNTHMTVQRAVCIESYSVALRMIASPRDHFKEVTRVLASAMSARNATGCRQQDGQDAQGTTLQLMVRQPDGTPPKTTGYGHLGHARCPTLLAVSSTETIVSGALSSPRNL
ncbi:uncharacterized protein PADG_01356 [Paracoccidioides brasiliensis Pb18]|uniref:Uncharacterized protein n=2 Tax=Paracoccidioides brasiliensis TaxID=121759 RepID=C1G340_PARBD|nr:uncharacterized protein PADG_01356 [Paracoccidioides brasiliensis Pb18]EEH45206.2 hypothetical protein PADG_01356 [Paracoccidioides brasiliensis Pb18]ODH14103.1 hypothetical protein ACO22_06690 [Paracoccidioides brasiliensis]ODH51318.1 hypothetical protein GX48_02558 [Paracoccidioides brasiliensis]